MQKVTTLVLPMGGLGKRLMPLTKYTAKNLVRVNGKPLVEYALEEAVESGIREVIFILNPKHKGQFEAYIKKNKHKFPKLTFHIRIQETPGGNGHAIAHAYDIASNKPFAVRFCDDVIIGEPPILQSLIDLYKKKKGSVVLLERVPMKMVSRFGVVGYKKSGQGLFEINKIVEKPPVKEAPSNLTIVGAYVLMPEVMRNLKMVVDTLPLVADDALPLAVALQIELILKGKIFGWELEPGRRLDCGTLEKLHEAEAILKAPKAQKS